jgi:two-component system, cell cycle response regulator DivK
MYFTKMTAVILVVDDNAANLKLAREILTAQGYEVISAVRGEQAVDVARAQRPALILLDMRLPDVDGLEVLRRLRSSPETKDLPVVAMTAQAMAGDRERFLAAGCDGYISKPIVLRTFYAEVERHLARRPA